MGFYWEQACLIFLLPFLCLILHLDKLKQNSFYEADRVPTIILNNMFLILVQSKLTDKYEKEWWRKKCLQSHKLSSHLANSVDIIHPHLVLSTPYPPKRIHEIFRWLILILSLCESSLCS